MKKEKDGSSDGNIYTEVPYSIRSVNTAGIGQALKLAPGAFPIDDAWRKRLAPLLLNPNQPIIFPKEEIDSELAWLETGLKAGYDIPVVPGKPIGSEILRLAQTDKPEYFLTSLDVKKRMAMGRIHSIHETLAAGMIAGDRDINKKLYDFLGFRLLNEPKLAGIHAMPRRAPSFLKAVFRAGARIFSNEQLVEQLVLSQGRSTETQDILDTSQNLGSQFSNYRNAVVYSSAWKNFPRQFQSAILYDEFSEDFVIPYETNLESQKGFGVGVNLLHDPDSYKPPDEKQWESILNTLSDTKTNIVPGGSDEYPKSYNARITEGMRLRDIWDIQNITLIGQHPQPVAPNTPLYLHIAMERSSNRAPLFASYNIRTKKLHLHIPDASYLGGTAELHLHLHALATDLSNIERSGISIHDDTQDQSFPPSNKIKVPQRRTFVVMPERITEVESDQIPTGFKHVTPRESTLPYGSRFTAALAELTKAREDKNASKIQEAELKVAGLARRLPEAKSETLERYKEKAIALGLDPQAIRVSEGRIVAAPRVGFNQPIFNQEDSTDEDSIRIIPKYGSKILWVNEALIMGNNSVIVEAESTTPPPPDTTDRSSKSLIRRLLRRK